MSDLSELRPTISKRNHNERRKHAEHAKLSGDLNPTPCPEMNFDASLHDSELDLKVRSVTNNLERNSRISLRAPRELTLNLCMHTALTNLWKPDVQSAILAAA